MLFSTLSDELTNSVAVAADLTLKPWIHSVIDKNSIEPAIQANNSIDELIVRIECRNQEGMRHPENDLEVEIFRSGKDLNLMIHLIGKPEQPILWHGQHSVWMEGTSGKRCTAPPFGGALESFARRLRAIFILSEES